MKKAKTVKKEIDINLLLNNFKKRNIPAFYFRDSSEFKTEILKVIPSTATIGFSGSQTIFTLGLIATFKERGNKVFDPYAKNLSLEEGQEIRKQATQADYYLASANAITLEGELVFFSAYGNRIAGISYAPKVIIICGINKVTSDLTEALKRAREYATPLNCRRLNWQSACLESGICKKEICFSPQFKRMCNQILVIENEVNLGRLSLFLIGENLGY